MKKLAPKILFLIPWIVFFAGCATSRKDVISLNQASLPPKQEREEKELRKISQEYQKYLEENNAFVQDKALVDYLNQVAAPFFKSLGSEAAANADFKIQVLRDPTINAVSLPTGHIYFHSGFLARIQNEDQLAFVLAHEISHVYHRDALYQYMNFKRKTVGYKIADLLLSVPATAFGAAGIGQAATAMVYGAAVQGYGRAQEDHADQFAIERVVAAGYDPLRAAAFFDILLNEYVKYQKGFEIYFLASHPSNLRRRGNMRAWIKAHGPHLSRIEKRLEVPEFLEKMYPLSLQNIKLNIDFGRYFHALEIVDDLIKRNPEDPYPYYYQGEIYRKLPESRIKIKEELASGEWKIIHKKDKTVQAAEWQRQSLEAYQKALEKNPDFAPACKGIGEWYFENQKWDEAKKYFTRYLELSPEARDKRSVTRYLQDIDENIAGQKVAA